MEKEKQDTKKIQTDLERKNQEEKELAEKELEEKELENEQTYDSVLAAMVMRFERYIAPLINEAFGEHFTQNAKVTIRNNKHIIRHTDGTLGRRETDSYVELSEYREKAVTKRYHIECETWYDRSIIVRIAEYSSAIAMENVEITEEGVRLYFPDSVVLFLRPNRNIPKHLVITHCAPNGKEMSYEIPAMQIRDYTSEEIFEKKLLILLPFYLFRYVNEFEQIEQNDEWSIIGNTLADIGERLEEFTKAGEINMYQQRTMLQLLKRVSDKLLVKYEKLRKGVDEVMSGYIARTDADDILEMGIEKGIEKGREEGKNEVTHLLNFLLTQGRNEEAIKATSDQAFLAKLLKEFHAGSVTSQ